MATINQPSPWWAQAVVVASLLALALLPLGALGVRYEYWSYRIGFLIIATAVILAGMAFAGGWAIIAASWKFGIPSGRWVLLFGMLLALAPLVLIGHQIQQMRSLPKIHNVTTDMQDPPQFDYAVQLRGPDANPLAYDAARVGPLQQQAYPDIRPLLVDLPPAESYQRSLDVLREMGLEIVHEDPRRGLIEAIATTQWFGFKDDVVVRVRPEGQGSRIDLRSVSRVGGSDLGANAKRIQQFLQRFDAGS
jgi:uncharacterized protein (DUF1499 family)